MCSLKKEKGKLPFTVFDESLSVECREWIFFEAKAEAGEESSGNSACSARKLWCSLKHRRLKVRVEL